MGFTLLCGGPWRRQPERRANDGLAAGSRRRLRDSEPKKREMLQKKRPAPPARPNHVDISAASGDTEPSAAELDVASPVDIPDCPELPADPPKAERLKSEPVSPASPPAPSTWIKQRSASLPGCPPFLVPGSAYAVAQAQPWPDPTPAATAAAMQLFRAVTSESQLESTFIDRQLSTATSPAPLPSPSSSSSAVRSASASTLPPLTPSTAASSRTSLPVATPDGIANPNLQSKGVDTHDTLPRDHRPRLGQLTPMRSAPRLSVRQSSGNIDQLLARHALLESRRQILLHLHEVEQEQEQIMEELAAMPEVLANCSELSC